MNEKYVRFWNILVFLSFFQYGQFCFSQETGGDKQVVEGVEAVPEAEKEKPWWEKAIDFFTGNDPLEEMIALNERLDQLLESQREVRESQREVRESQREVRESQQRQREELQKISERIDRLEKDRQNN